MTRVTPWLTAAAVAALASVSAAAQQPPTPTPEPAPQQEQTQPATSTQPSEHISKAKMAVEGISKDAVQGTAVGKMSELRRHLNALEKADAKSWATHVAAIDKCITELSADASVGAEVKAKLEEVRTHVTAFAAAKSGTAPAASEPAGAAARPAPTTGTPTTGTQPQPTPPTEPQTPPSAAPAVDPAVVRQHLSEARRVLSEITQMPQAAQLQGEARTQVSQLITNFNALITAETDWKDKYMAVDQNLTMLIGPGAAAAGTSGTSGTPGATGTTGTTAAPAAPAASAPITLDPAVKTKLEEVRKHLTAFYAAASGGQIPQ